MDKVREEKFANLSIQSNKIGKRYVYVCINGVNIGERVVPLWCF